MKDVASHSESAPRYAPLELVSLPVGWTTSRLGDCGEVIMGQSPPGASYNRAMIGCPLINGPTEFTERLPRKIQWTTEPVRLCEQGDLLICVRGSSTGRTNYADDIYAIGRGVAAIRAKGQNSTEYLSHQVISSVTRIVARATGSTFPSVDGESFRNIILPLPPPAEQRAITEALSDVDNLLVALDALIAKKRDIKQAAVEELLTGKTRLPGFSGKRKVVGIGDLLSYERPDRYIVKSTDYSEQGDVPVLTANKSFVLGYTNESFGVCYGLPAIVFDDFTTDCKYVTIPFKVKSSAIKLLRPKHGRVSLKYVFECMQSLRFPMGDHKRYYISEYQHVRLLLPDYDEQVAIVSALSDVDSEVDALEQRMDKTRAIKQGMMQELLTGRVRLMLPSGTEEAE